MYFRGRPAAHRRERGENGGGGGETTTVADLVACSHQKRGYNGQGGLPGNPVPEGGRNAVSSRV